MNREEMRRFVELVDTGAPLKTYMRELGLTMHSYKYHLTRLHYYREVLAEEPQVVKPAPEPTPEPAPVATTVVEEEPELETEVEDEGDDVEEEEELENEEEEEEEDDEDA